MIDTNLLVRYLVQDNQRQAQAAERLFDACDAGELVIEIIPIVLAECVFVLESFYEQARLQIATTLTRLVTCPGIEMPDRSMYVDALRRYGETKLHFVDCVLAGFAVSKDLPVATFDQDFRKFPDVRRLDVEAGR